MKVQAKIITEQECKWYGVAPQDGNTEWENRYKENGIKFETRVNI